MRFMFFRMVRGFAQSQFRLPIVSGEGDTSMLQRPSGFVFA
jgi:hypothetical protein